MPYTGNKPGPMPEGAGWKVIYFFCALIIGIRLVFPFIMGLMPQDAYYDFYGRHLALSYFDHPPMIAYLLRLFTSLFGQKVFVLKMADTFVTCLTLIAFFQLSKKFLPGDKPWKASALLVSTLMISILSLVSTPDVPLMLCWTLSLHFLYGAIFRNKNIHWLWAGILTGLSFDSKYTAVFLIFGLVGFLCLSKSHRRFLFSRWFILFLLSFSITILPVIIWNQENGFASFKFQSAGRAQEGLQIDPLGFFGVIGHQSAILLPFLFFSFCYFIYRIIRRYGIRFTSIADDQLFLLSFFVPLFLGFIGLSFFYWVKLNWIMPAYISGIIWITRFWNKKWIRYQLIFSLLIHMAMALEIIFYIIPIRSDDTWFGWKEFSEKTDSIQKKYPGSFIFSADDYKTAAILNFYLEGPVFSKNVVGEKALQFDYVGTDLSKLNGKNAIFINSNPRFNNLENEQSSVPAFYHDYFSEIVPLNPILVSRNGHVERKWSVFLCKNYHYIQKLPKPVE
jgi:hypothetical protein